MTIKSSVLTLIADQNKVVIKDILEQVEKSQCGQ